MPSSAYACGSGFHFLDGPEVFYFYAGLIAFLVLASWSLFIIIRNRYRSSVNPNFKFHTKTMMLHIFALVGSLILPMYLADMFGWFGFYSVIGLMFAHNRFLIHLSNKWYKQPFEQDA